MSLDLAKVWEQTRELMKARRYNAEEAYSELIALYEGYLEGEISPGDTQILMQELASSQSFFGKLDDAKLTVNRLVSLYPESVVCLTFASGFFALNIGDEKQALYLAYEAVDKSEEEGRLKIFSLTNLGRVARWLNRFDLLPGIIQRVLDEQAKGRQSTKIECDYVLDLPNGAVPDDLVLSLRRLAGR